MVMSAILAAAALALSPPQRAAEFTSGLGVNIHIEYTDGGYRDPSRVLDCLHYLGVSFVRDAAPNPRNQGQGSYAALAKAGVKFDLFVNGEEIAPALRRIADLEREVPGSVTSIEGMNEVNNHPGFTYGGESDLHRSGLAYQAELYSRVKATSALASIPVVGFTDYPSTFGRSDIGNTHSYPHGDGAPLAILSPAVAETAAHLPGQPIMITEVGFSTSRGRSGVSELAQSRLLLVSLLDDAALGVRRSYIYQLLDAYPDPSGLDGEKHYGLFRLDYSPKPAARMLHLLTSIYADPSADAARFALRPMMLRLAGGAPGVRTLVVAKADGELVAALWREQAVYDFSRADDVAIAPMAVDLVLPHQHGPVIVNDPVAATRGEIAANAATTRVLVGADPMIVDIRPAAEQGR